MNNNQYNPAQLITNQQNHAAITVSKDKVSRAISRETTKEQNVAITRKPSGNNNIIDYNNNATDEQISGNEARSKQQIIVTTRRS